MALSVKMALAATAGLMVATPAFATNFNLVAKSTGGGDYSFDINDTAPGKGTFTDTFTFTIPGAKNGSSDLGIFNVAATTSSANIDFISGSVTGPGTDVGLSASNAHAISSLSNSFAIPVVAGATYVLTATYLSAGTGLINGNIAFTAAPEPATWAFLMLGFGAVGAALRARRRTQPAVRVAYS
jgi:hypothetical protein